MECLNIFHWLSCSAFYIVIDVGSDVQIGIEFSTKIWNRNGGSYCGCTDNGVAFFDQQTTF